MRQQFDNFFQAMIALMVGESATSRIKRKQAEIAAVVDRNTAAINKAIDDEINALQTTVQSAFSRITDLLGTGALNTKKADAVSKARAEIDAALEALDAAF